MKVFTYLCMYVHVLYVCISNHLKWYLRLVYVGKCVILHSITAAIHSKVMILSEAVNKRPSQSI